ASPGIKISPSRAVFEAGVFARGLGLGLHGDGLAHLFGSDGDRLSEGNDSPGGGRVRLPHLYSRTANPLHITREKSNRTASPIPENRSVATRTAPGKLERLLTVQEVGATTGRAVAPLKHGR